MQYTEAQVRSIVSSTFPYRDNPSVGQRLAKLGSHLKKHAQAKTPGGKDKIWNNVESEARELELEVRILSQYAK